jgi:putative transposase
MPRKPRIDFPGAWHHVMHRGARRAPIFRSDDDCLRFLGVVEDAADRFGIEVHAWSLMPNHYHLLVCSV